MVTSQEGGDMRACTEQVLVLVDCPACPFCPTVVVCPSLFWPVPWLVWRPPPGPGVRFKLGIVFLRALRKLFVSAGKLVSSLTLLEQFALILSVSVRRRESGEPSFNLSTASRISEVFLGHSKIFSWREALKFFVLFTPRGLTNVGVGRFGIDLRRNR